MAYKMKYKKGAFPFKTGSKIKKSTESAHGQLEDAQIEYEEDLKRQKVDLTKKPVGPRATKKKIKKDDNTPLSPGFEDPLKIQKLQREGLTPGSQKFMKRKK